MIHLQNGPIRAAERGGAPSVSMTKTETEKWRDECLSLSRPGAVFPSAPGRGNVQSEQQQLSVAAATAVHNNNTTYEMMNKKKEA